MLNRKGLIIFFPLFLFGICGFSQVKYEMEISVKEDQVPGNALKVIDNFNFNKKVKWYKEFGLDDTTYEAKTKYQGKKYSVEFSTEGSLEDVEIRTKEKSIPTPSLNKMGELLASRFSKYRLRKIQIQYLGDPNVMLTSIRSGKLLPGVVKNYEIVVVGKVDKSYKAIEFLFSEEGDLILSREIIERRQDHIEF
ncbi:MAG: hypothetical protein HKN16_12550 [Saprospiraceae bacterium]|nr:hypothetical protein [Saprospiraceae bacterium]